MTMKASRDTAPRFIKFLKRSLQGQRPESAGPTELTIDLRRGLWMDCFSPPFKAGERILISAVGSELFVVPVIERLVQTAPGTTFLYVSDSPFDLPIPSASSDLLASGRSPEAEFDGLLFVTDNEAHPHHRNALSRLCACCKFAAAYILGPHFHLFDITQHTLTPEAGGKRHRTFAYVEPSTWHWLYTIARSGPGRGAVVEIGSYVGGTTLALAAGCVAGERGRVVTVDVTLVDG
ncbi:MAG: hypothetical protein GY842_06225, partial [bacterium]|nr:hypothetical protein [bacterium]